jgi:hypothetical protein
MSSAGHTFNRKAAGEAWKMGLGSGYVDGACVAFTGS